MKRKKSKLIGLVLMISAILLQVGYASTVNIVGVAGTEDYRIEMESEAGESSEYVNVNLKADENKGGVVLVDVGNLYPGAYFTVISHIKNVGKKDVRFKSADIKCLDEQNKALYDNLVFYDDKGTVMSLENYKAYLNTRHQENKFKVGENEQLALRMGLSPEVTNLENTKTSFLIEILYEQEKEVIVDPGEGGGSGGGGGGSSGGGPGTPGTIITPPTPSIPINPANPEEIQIPEEMTPAGPVVADGTEETAPQQPEEIDVPEEVIPQGPAKLPKTGGMSSLFVYALGLTMLGGGISIYRKGKKQE